MKIKTSLKREEPEARLAIDCLKALAEHGWKVRSVPAGRIGDLDSEIRSLRDSGMISDDHYALCMDCWDFTTTRGLTDAASLLIVASPSRTRRLAFHTETRRVTTVLPPIFAERFSFKASVMECLSSILGPAGHSALPARLPEKLLAARTGLARIGGNHIAYVDGMGSYCRLGSFIADMPFPDDGWGEILRPDACADCGACERACPSGALGGGGDRFDHGRCLCYLNEETADPFPAWTEQAWHHAFMGCMRCQEACPLNADFRGAVAEGPFFDANETEAILSMSPLTREEELPQPLREKIAECGLSSLLSVLPRNLRALLDKS
jgi:epoxyqueuosine reductase